MLRDSILLYTPVCKLRPQHLLTFVSCVCTNMQLRPAEQFWSGRFLHIEHVFSPWSSMSVCWLCIQVYLILIRVATLPRTPWTGPRIQRMRIDAILKEDTTNSCVLRFSPVYNNGNSHIAMQTLPCTVVTDTMNSIRKYTTQYHQSTACKKSLWLA